jgi:3-hydroxyisobutyrate dehydrogenase-like beta-hydroxyacid dehydrogenase
VGGPGAGHTVKLVNQVVVSLAIEAVAEALALAERCGLDLELVRDALTGGSADSRVLQVQGSRMIAHDYTPAAKAPSGCLAPRPELSRRIRPPQRRRE